MFDWIRALFNRSSRTLRDDDISTTALPGTLYGASVLDDDSSQDDSWGSDHSGGSDSGGGSDAGGGGGAGS
jgi:hypothetical protein